MQNEDLDRTFGFLVHDIGRLMRREFERRVRDMGFTRNQWRVLAHLRRVDGINQSQLADRMDVEPIALVRLLDKLEAAGYVQRRQNARLVRCTAGVVVRHRQQFVMLDDA